MIFTYMREGNPLDQRPHRYEERNKDLWEAAQLRWRLIERSRQSWTCLSMAVLASCLWLLSRQSETTGASTLGWATGPAAILFSVGFSAVQHSIRRIQQRLGTVERRTTALRRLLTQG